MSNWDPKNPNGALPSWDLGPTPETRVDAPYQPPSGPSGSHGQAGMQPAYTPAVPAPGYPQGYPPQTYPQGQPLQGYPQGYPPQGYPQSYPPQGYPPQGYPQGYPPQGYPQGYPPQGYPVQPMVINVMGGSATATAIVRGPGFNHGFHLLMTFFTCGAWIPIWIIAAVTHRD